ncbi:pyridoxal phosphate-dependent decarboxylase family protein [Desulfopila aestuarii]|uniref:Sulfinoalanine decarboxylase n=1 Tax=Desulfopila aestuarii DSM 18488 TaxID=1121416 RepID=A0A1M7Y7N1_9BACT|nr:pyridoxal-dependent decarboxylase [Desulfopila aestuarii]SHO48591.1 sulfinoalanine decarboxylase [Desulfopila aestuarii DSM 18488]
MVSETDLFRRLFDVLEQHSREQNCGNFLQYHSPAELTALLDLDRENTEGDWDPIFSWISQYLEYGVKTSHPSFVNRMWAGANPPSILGDIVVAATNTSACTYESAPVSTLFEKYMIEQMLELVGFKNGEGQMTTGSSNANMIAMMCARNLACEQVKQRGLFAQRELFAFVNNDAHYSMDKAANILGLGSEHLVKVEVNERGEMEPVALKAAIEQVVGAGGVPFFVAATEGTTVRGAYDPITPLLALRKKYGFWLHADGAWGGAAVMSDSLKDEFMAGLSEVDSFTCDFHKMLGSALMCNVLLINHSNRTLGAVLGGGDGSYLFRDTEDSGVRDLGTTSLQCGRRVDSLKWFLDWKYYGKTGFGKRIENYLELCKYAEECVHSYPELELVTPRVSFNICFRYKVNEEIANSFNQELRTRLYQQGLALVGIAYIGELLVMRLLITNTNVGRQEIDQFFRQLVDLGQEMAA